MSRRSRLSRILVNTTLVFGSLILSVFLTDFALRLIGTRYTRVAFERRTNTRVLSRNMVTTLFKPDLRISYRAKSSGKELFHVEYTTDSFGRRVTPLSPGRRSKSLLIFGCSMAFGQTVNDSQTIPFYLGELLKDFEPYNYAVGGGGIQNLYTVLSRTDLRREVTQAEGLAVYLYYPYHMDRLQDHFSNLQNYYNSYRIQDGHLERIPLTLFSRLFTLSHESPLFERAASFFFPMPPPDEEDYRLAAMLFKESMNLYERDFDKGRFVVVIVGQDERLSRRLDALKVPHLSVEELDPSFTYDPDDHHYTAEGNSKMAVQIVRALRAWGPRL